MNSQAIREYDAWQTLCNQLKEPGAVTENDLLSSTTATETPGQRLFRAIEQWGEELVKLRNQ